MNKLRSYIIVIISISILFPVQYLILCHSSMIEAANEISSIYSSDPSKHYYLTTEIVLTDSYTPYDLKQTVNNKIEDYNDLEYLLIIGDEDNFPNYYHSVYCNDQNLEYPTDDYYSSLSLNYLDTISSDNKPRLSTGRIPASDLDEALVYTNKLSRYLNSTDFGAWRSKILLIADDQNKAGSSISNEIKHTQYSDIIYDKISDITFTKTLYGVMYEPVYLGSDLRLPELTDDIIKDINDGVALVNYIGHGDPNKWSSENIIEKNRDINLLNITNERLPIWVAGTCSFGRYDNIESMSESLLFEVNGAIAIVGAARSINEAVNRDFSDFFYDKIKQSIESDNTYRLGDAFLNAKQNLNNASYVSTCNGGYLFNIIGDPAIPLMFGKSENNYNSFPDEIEILEPLVINNNESYLYIEIIDKEKDITIVYPQENDTLNFNVSPDIIYNNESLNQSICFIPPIDIISPIPEQNFTYIKLFTQDDNYKSIIRKSKLIEIIYSQDQIEDIENNDIQGPEIIFSLNKFILSDNAYISNNSVIEINITDDIGVNILNNIGHNIRYWFDEESSYSIVNNEDLSFTNECNQVSFNINIPNSFYHGTLNVEAWDNINNYSYDSIKLNTSKSGTDVDKIFNVYNFPNPFSERTFFTYQIKDFSKTSVSTELNIYTQNGKNIKKINDNTEEMTNFISIEWDGTNQNGLLVPNGTYLYTLNINLENQEYNKMGSISIVR